MKIKLAHSAVLPLFLLITGTLALVAITDRYILTINFYERTGQPMSGIPDTESLVYHRVSNVIYVYSVGYITIKVLVISMLIATGLFFFGIKARFRDIIRMVTLSELVFLVPAAVKICWYWQARNTVDLVTWQNFYFLSAASLFTHIKPAFLLPLQTLNVFEAAYWFLLARGLTKIAAVNFDQALKVVLVSYLPALFVWVIFMVYITVVYFPQSY